MQAGFTVGKSPGIRHSSEQLSRVELTGPTGHLHLDRYTLPAMTKTTLATIALPAGFGSFNLETNPLALAVSLHAAGSGVHNLRYRPVYDPDSDDDLLPDRWEQKIVTAFPERFATVAQVAPGGDADGDSLTHQREYELGTDPTKTDSELCSSPRRRCDLCELTVGPLIIPELQANRGANLGGVCERFPFNLSKLRHRRSVGAHLASVRRCDPCL